MQQAIRTKYLPPTDTRGARIRAVAESGTVTVPYDYGAATSRDVHFRAVARLCAALGWPAAGWIGGSLADGSFAWVCEEASS